MGRECCRENCGVRGKGGVGSRGLGPGGGGQRSQQSQAQEDSMAAHLELCYGVACAHGNASVTVTLSRENSHSLGKWNSPDGISGDP